MTDILKIFLAAIAVVVVFLVLAIPLAILNGWVLSWLWLWFAVPLGLPVIGVVHSIGIAGLISFLTKQYSGKDEEDKYNAIAYGFLLPFFALGFGYIVHSFM